MSGKPAAVAFRWLRRHALLMLVSLAVLFAAGRWYPGYAGSGWFFWLALGWGAALLVHFLIAKSLSVDEDWAHDRADDLRFKSYDHKHIDAIRGHYIKPRRRR